MRAEFVAGLLPLGRWSDFPARILEGHPELATGGTSQGLCRDGLVRQPRTRRLASPSVPSDGERRMPWWRPASLGRWHRGNVVKSVVEPLSQNAHDACVPYEEPRIPSQFGNADDNLLVR